MTFDILFCYSVTTAACCACDKDVCHFWFRITCILFQSVNVPGRTGSLLYIYMICVCDSVFVFQALEQLFSVWQNESVR